MECIMIKPSNDAFNIWISLSNDFVRHIPSELSGICSVSADLRRSTCSQSLLVDYSSTVNNLELRNAVIKQRWLMVNVGDNALSMSSPTVCSINYPLQSNHLQFILQCHIYDTRRMYSLSITESHVCSVLCKESTIYSLYTHTRNSLLHSRQYYHLEGWQNAYSIKERVCAAHYCTH